MVSYRVGSSSLFFDQCQIFPTNPPGQILLRCNDQNRSTIIARATIEQSSIGHISHPPVVNNSYTIEVSLC